MDRENIKIEIIQEFRKYCHHQSQTLKKCIGKSCDSCYDEFLLEMIVDKIVQLDQIKTVLEEINNEWK